MKTAVVTGAARGIGLETARTFALAGYTVVLADKDEAGGILAQEQIIAGGGKALFIATDVSLPPMIDLLFSKIKSDIGRLDVLVNNAGFGIWKSPAELTVDEWDAVINTNLRGAFLCSRAAAGIMSGNGGGAIINIASTRALMSEENSEAYAASKGGITALTHALAASLAKHRIRVNCISPGWIETGDYSKLREKDHLQHFSQRVGMPSDIARACLFIAENDFINGENLVIDGGMTRRMIYEP